MGDTIVRLQATDLDLSDASDDALSVLSVGFGYLYDTAERSAGDPQPALRGYIGVADLQDFDARMDAAEPGPLAALCVDFDRDGEFGTDETFAPRVCGERLVYGPIPLAAKRGRAAVVLIATVETVALGEDSGVQRWVSISVVPSQVQSGSLEVDGETYPVYVWDRDLDGQYVAPEARGPDIYEAESWLWVDADRDGEPDLPLLGSGDAGPTEIVWGAGAARVGRDWRALRVSGGGGRLAVGDPLPSGIVAYDGDRVNLVLLTDLGKYVLASGAGGVARLPAGDYGLQGYDLVSTVAGRQVSITCGPPDGANAPKLHIRADQTVRIPVVRAVGVAVSLDRPPDSDDYSLSLTVTGDQGQDIQSISIDGDDPPPPTFKLVDGRGNVVESGEFEYG